MTSTASSCFLSGRRRHAFCLIFAETLTGATALMAGRLPLLLRLHSLRNLPRNVYPGILLPVTGVFSGRVVPVTLCSTRAQIHRRERCPMTQGRTVVENHSCSSCIVLLCSLPLGWMPEMDFVSTSRCMYNCKLSSWLIL